MTNVRVCPVCWQRATKATHSKTITHHWDSIGQDVCPGSGLEWRLAPPWSARQHRRAVQRNRAFVA